MNSTSDSTVFDRIADIFSFTKIVSRWLSYIGMAVLFAMISLTFLDVFLRYFFSRSIIGTVEITSLMMVITVFSCIAWTQDMNSHVTMDIITSKLKDGPRAALASVTTMWSFITIALCAWCIFLYGMKTGSNTQVLRIPLRYSILFTAFGFSMLALVLLRDLFRNLGTSSRQFGSGKAVGWLLLGLVPVCATWWLATHKIPGMSSVFIGIAGIIFMFILFFSGMPVAFSLMATGLIFIAQLKGINASVGTVGKAMYATASSYSWSPLMLFMLMGYYCFYARFGEDIYVCARRWMGHYRGGLAQGSVAACTVFGAVVGDTLAGSIAMSAIALPEMRRNGYEDRLSVGTLACSGTIGALIPPSSTFIIYAVLAQQSIGDMFIAGVVPGLMCMFCFMIAIWLLCWHSPSLAPRLERSSMHDRMESLKSGLPIIALFLLVIGGIYGGVFTATEGGGIGAFGTLLLALVMRRMHWAEFKKSMADSVQFISMCFTVLCGAIVLSYFMAMSRIPMLLANGIAALEMPGWAVLIGIILVMSFLGCFLPSMPLLLICVPIFIPIAKVFGWDLIWFGIIITILDNMASITPPFGINLFVMKEVAGVSLGTMYKSSIPFVLALFLCLALVILFPPLSTWLPSMMYH
ncbi:MAG: TRAP transporter large permease subunit [Mailhella sp.]